MKPTKESFNSGADNDLMKQVLNDRVNQVFGVIRAAVPAHFESMYGDTSKLKGEERRQELERKRQTRKWQAQDGQDRSTTEIIVDGFSGQMQMLDGKQDNSQQNYQQQAPQQQAGATGGFDDFDQDIPF